MESSNNKNVIYNFFKRLSSANAEDQEFKKCVVKYFFSTLAFIVVCIILFGILKNPSSSNYNIQKYFFLYMFPLLMIFAIILNLAKNSNNRTPFLEILGIGIVVVCAVYYYAISTTSYELTDTVSNTLFGIAILLIGLAIVYNVLIGYMSRLRGWPGFIAQLIFYLPCVLYDAWLALLEQFKLTPFAIYALIVVEIILIVMYIYLPSITQYVTGTENSLLLVKNVIPLNQGQKTVATSQMLKMQPTDEQKQMGITRPFASRNYCISFWLYINNQDPANYSYSRESQILNYGYLDKDGLYQVKPLVTYYGGGNTTDQPMERNKLIFYFVNYKDIRLEDELKSYLPVVQNKISAIKSKIEDYDILLANKKLSELEKEDMQNDIKSLNSQLTTMSNKVLKEELNNKITSLKNTIRTGKLSQSQINDLKKSKEQAEATLQLLEMYEDGSEEELSFLDNQTYENAKYTFYPVTVPTQAWNQVVLNYNDNTVDLFINGDLERTFYLAGGDIPPKEYEAPGNPETFLPKYSDLDTITVGDKNGLDGGICNVVYYKTPLSAEQIAFTYNSMVGKNPPIPREEQDKTLTNSQ
jgi:hypothetical protein